VHCRDWIRSEVSTEDLSKDCNLKGIKKQLLRSDDLPVFEAKQITLDGLMEEGDRLVHEVHSLKPAFLVLSLVAFNPSCAVLQQVSSDWQSSLMRWTCVVCNMLDIGTVVTESGLQ
jgi:hypothetical protein